MHKQPPIVTDDAAYTAAQKLEGTVAIVTGSDSGIGAATAIAFAKEGARVVVHYFEHAEDAESVQRTITEQGGTCICIQADVRQKEDCARMVQETIDAFGAIDIVVNNAGTQVTQEHLEDISEEQLQNTFETNMFSMFYITQAALPHMQPGSSIINTTSVTAYRGSADLIGYSATKGAIIAFTRSLSQNLAARQIRVNAVAPGPVWTPLVATSFDDKKLADFGKSQPLGRAGQPIDIAPAYVFLASRDSRYMTGQVLHLNGGEVVNS